MYRAHVQVQSYKSPPLGSHDHRTDACKCKTGIVWARIRWLVSRDSVSQYTIPEAIMFCAFLYLNIQTQKRARAVWYSAVTEINLIPVLSPKKTLRDGTPRTKIKDWRGVCAILLRLYTSVKHPETVYTSQGHLFEICYFK
jgi:hypothetical protein